MDDTPKNLFSLCAGEMLCPPYPLSPIPLTPCGFSDRGYRLPLAFQPDAIATKPSIDSPKPSRAVGIKG